MEQIIPISGKVTFPVTLDPGVWIFDDRRVDVDEFFSAGFSGEKNEQEEYIKVTSAFWEKEIREGAVFPKTIKSERKYEREKALTGTFAVPLKPFLSNAKPTEEAAFIDFYSDDEKMTFPLTEVDNMLLQFSQKGKPLQDDGPVYVLFKDGSNLNSPLKHVQRIVIR